MNMQYWLLIIANALMYSNWSWCQKISLETSRHSHIGNISQNICPKSEHEVIYPHKVGKLSNLHKNYENDMVELIKHKFTSMAGSRLKSDVRKDEVQDDPNLIQALMSRAFIDNANLAFHKNDINKDEDSGTFLIGKHVFQVNKYSKVKSDLDKPSHSSARGKRDTLIDKTDLDDSDEPEDSFYEKRDRLKVPEEEMRIHCVRAGPSEVMCKHDNYTYSFKLPIELFDKKVMENLVSSVCSIIEEASPEGGGKVELSVKKSYNLIKKDRDSYKSKNIGSTKSELKERKEDPERVVNKVIRINIPIDFSAIPLGAEEEDKSQSDRSEQELKGARDSDTSAFDKQPNKLTKKTKYQQSKSDDISSSNTDESTDNLALMKSNDCNYNNVGKDEYQEKWLHKRDNLQKPMVFPPSLILFKRSSNNLENQQNNLFNRYSYNLTSCEENGNNK